MKHIDKDERYGKRKDEEEEEETEKGEVRVGELRLEEKQRKDT